MIKYEVTRSGKSYFRPNNEDYYDLTRNTRKKIKLFGLTIWEKSDIISDLEIVNLNSKGEMGFKKENGH